MSTTPDCQGSVSGSAHEHDDVSPDPVPFSDALEELADTWVTGGRAEDAERLRAMFPPVVPQ